MDKLIISACICGAEVTKEQNPAVPYTVEEIVREDDGKNVVICTHGGVIKALCSHFLGKWANGINDVEWASNASITEVWYNDGKYSIEKFSFDDYLGELKTELPKTV